jgi:hypothetical protein
LKMNVHFSRTDHTSPVPPCPADLSISDTRAAFISDAKRTQLHTLGTETSRPTETVAIQFTLFDFSFQACRMITPFLTLLTK